jgi:hypothetical protein
VCQQWQQQLLLLPLLTLLVAQDAIEPSMFCNLFVGRHVISLLLQQQHA